MKNSRVLGRMGARELTVEETERVAGSIHVHANVCTALTTTGHLFGDGDGCGTDNDG